VYPQEQYVFPEAQAIPPPAPPRRYWLHILLFLLTVASTVMVGGWAFSATLLSILTAHEFGHYLTARRYRVPASLPYFIPFPFSLFGTLGAVIRMSPRMPNRRALFDIAAAGPLAGLVIAIPASYVGITLSRVVAKGAVSANMISLGDPLLFKALSWLALGNLGENTDLLLHPMAFAGWAGMFVTALNLLPIGQLDGGHVSHALFGDRSYLVALAMFGGLLGFSLMEGNVTWVPLLLLLLLFGIRHPRSYDDGRALGNARLALGLLLAAVFVTCFVLVPIRF
jgi:membrane-associated protease RseP (regulator of RpoE activity)